LASITAERHNSHLPFQSKVFIADAMAVCPGLTESRLPYVMALLESSDPEGKAIALRQALKMIDSAKTIHTHRFRDYLSH
jgi:hypothetical protein